MADLKPQKLTSRNASSLSCPAGKSEIVYWSSELTGFGLRCRSGGLRSWFCQYRTKAGETRKHTLGNPVEVPFADAFKAARELIAEARLGHDPAGDVKRAKAEKRAAITVAELVEKYLSHQRARMRARSYVEVQRHLGDRIKPIRTKAAAGVTQRQIVELLQNIAEAAPVQANRTRSSLSALYSWGMKSGLVSANPVAMTFVPSQETPRDRVLTDDELRLIWRCTSSGGDYNAIVRLLLLLGQRREEIGGMAWEELTLHDDGSATWTLPKERAKNGRSNMLTLPRLAVEQLPPRREGRDLVFGEGAGSFSGWSQSKSRLDKRIAAANDGKPIAAWVLHDLRRTAVTGLHDLGAEPSAIEAIVNHISSGARAGVAGVYNRSAYNTQKAAALKLWADHVARLVGETPTGEAEIVRLRA